MTNTKPLQEPEDNGSPPQEKPEPPVPGLAVTEVADEQDTAQVEATIDEVMDTNVVITPEQPASLVSGLRYERRVLPLQLKNENDCEELEKLLNELGQVGFNIMPFVVVGDEISALVMQRPVYVINGSGDAAGAVGDAEQRDDAELAASLMDIPA